MLFLKTRYSMMFADFFCLKRKTAYEMRISDWSSDVCSSDLCALPGKGNRAVAAEDGGRQAYFLPMDDGRFMPTPHAGGAWNVAEQHVAPAIGLLVHALVDDPAARPAAIGRASCRERVCEYDYLSVCAVSLTKTVKTPDVHSQPHPSKK